VSEAKHPRRLIEVDLPIKEISSQSAREKSIRHGHISTLHIWWARRPLAACRSVILAALLPDPVDPLCSNAFVSEANAALSELRDKIGGRPVVVSDRNALRARLLSFVAKFADWNSATQPHFITAARQLVHAAGMVHGSTNGIPVVLDPFAGGGAIPLEAARCGASVLAGDLNPIAVLQNRVLTELAPGITQKLIDEFEALGLDVERRAFEVLAKSHNDLAKKDAPFTWFVARTVQCEGPACGVHVPLVRGFSLSTTKQISLAWARNGASKVNTEEDPVTHATRPAMTVSADKHASKASTSGGSAVCPVCGFTTKQSRIASQASERGFGYRLVAVGVLSSGSKTYRAPTKAEEISFATVSTKADDELLASALNVPINSLRPSSAARGMSAVTRYGYAKYGALFGGRQRHIIAAFQSAVGDLLQGREPRERELLSILLLFAVDRLSTFQNLFCRWAPKGEHPVPPFGKNGFPMVWDFAIANPFSDAAGSWAGGVHWIALVLRHLAASRIPGGTVQRVAAQVQWMPNDSVDALITDPPYYDSYPYADLSDFFFPLLASGLQRVGLSTEDWKVGSLSPKDDELVVQPTRVVSGQPKDSAFYERGLKEAFESARHAVRPNGIGVVVFANKTTQGWEAVLGALLDAGWVVTASWPIQTERESRTRGEARLQSSVHIVCRPREEADGSLKKDAVGDWREVLAELPARMHEWMPRLSSEGIVGADAIFACLGPALEIFSRYARVEKVNGEPVALREYLEHVWSAVSREALAMVFRDADTLGLEEDARLSAMWLWTIAGPALPGEAASTEDSAEDDDEDTGDDGPEPKGHAGGFTLEYDAVRKIAQGLGAQLGDLTHLVEIKKDKARLLGVAERTAHLFGKAEGVTNTKKAAKKKQLTLFAEIDEVAEAQGWGEVGAPKAGTTVLDRVHQAMLLFAAGRSEALKRFLVDEGAGKQPQFWKLSQALSALYPSGTDEKRWVDGVLARKKGLGFG
jgi:putative DNA methylase